MITKREILERAAEWQLRPEVVEKDYALGWALSAIARHPITANQWVLKGGTCVKKCFFETYRFSEDLDFSLLPGTSYDEISIKGVLQEIADITSELSGIRFSPDHVIVKVCKDKLGRPTFEGRLGYQGPLAVPGWPRILFDITQHEPIILPTVRREIIHSYTDLLPPNTDVQTYAFEELLAEKTRALYERTRPRDLYDVAYILDNLEQPLDAQTVRRVFAEKCRTKGFEPPSSQTLVHKVRESEELRADWTEMLAHQLPQLPPPEGAIDRLERALEWLAHKPRIIGMSTALPELTDAARSGNIVPLHFGGRVTDQLRFAGANRLLVGFDYHGKARIVEPYSLRQAKTTGNLLFYGWELASRQIKCFKVREMHNVRPLDRTFIPRYHVEIGTVSSVIQTGRWKW